MRDEDTPSVRDEEMPAVRDYELPVDSTTQSVGLQCSVTQVNRNWGDQYEWLYNINNNI